MTNLSLYDGILLFHTAKSENERCRWMSLGKVCGMNRNSIYSRTALEDRLAQGREESFVLLFINAQACLVFWDLN